MKNKKDSTVLLKLFLIILLLGAVISISYKAFNLFTNRNLKASSYNILFITKNVYILHFDTKLKRINIVKVEGAPETIYEDTRIQNSILLGVPFDGMIVDKTTTKDVNILFTGREFAQVMTGGKQYEISNLNSFDLFNFFLTAQFLTREKAREEMGFNQLGTESGLSDKFYSLVKDEEIYNDKSSIEIINDTQINGLGGNISQMLKNVGYNVVSVRSSGQENPAAEIVNRSIDSAAINKLVSFFNLPQRRETDLDIADVTVIIDSNWIKNNFKN